MKHLIRLLLLGALVFGITHQKSPFTSYCCTCGDKLFKTCHVFLNDYLNKE